MRARIVLFVLSFSGVAFAENKECLDAAQKGQELRDQGKLVSARDLFARCAETSCPAPVPTYCKQWLAELRPRIPTIVIRASDAAGRDVVEATVRIDGNVVSGHLDGKPIEVDPGNHVVRVEPHGLKPMEQNVVAAASERDRIVLLKLESEPPKTELVTTTKTEEPRPVPRKKIPTASWIAWGVGAAGFVGFAIFGVKANADWSSLRSSCGSSCTDDDRDSFRTTVRIADIALVIGVAGAVAGTVIYLLQPSPTAGSTAHAR